MTVSTSTSRNEYAGNGVTTVFAYSFRILDEDHVEVILVNSSGVETVQTKTTHYTVSGVGASGGGNITMVTAPATGEQIVIKRSMPFTQQTDYTSGDPFSAETHEDALDIRTMEAQELNEKINRAILAPVQDASIGLLGTISDRSLRVLSFDGDGNPQTSLSVTEISNLLNNVNISGTINGYQTLAEWHIGSEFDASNEIALTNNFTVANNNVLVFKNGVGPLRLGASYDYLETDVNKIQLTYDPLPDDNFLFIIGSMTSNEPALPAVTTEYILGSAAVSRVFTVSNQYTPGNNSLRVELNGHALRRGASFDYTETSTTTVTLTYDPDPNDVYSFHIGIPQTRDSVSAAAVTFTSAGTGAVATNVDAVLKDMFVTPQMFGAVGDGVTDDTAAIQSAVNAAAAGYGEVFIPNGTYLLNGAAGSDSFANGVLLDSGSTDASGTTGRVTIRCEGPGVTLRAGSDNMYIIRCASTYNVIKGWPTLDAAGRSNVRHLGLVPVDETQVSTLVHQNFNYIEIDAMTGGTEGILMKCGPIVGAAQSGCFYNEIHVRRINNCVRSCFLQSGPNTNSALCNRNLFFLGQCGDGAANTGVHIEAGDTNVFFHTNFETIVTGTAPNTVPTAIKVAQIDVWGTGSNANNKFIGCTIESATRHIEVANRLTEFYGMTYDITKSLLTARPTVLMGGDWSTSIQYMGPIGYTDAGAQAIPNGVVTVLNDPASGGIRFQNDTQQLADEGHQWQTFTQYKYSSTVVTGLTGTYTVGETVTGGTSSATGVVDTWDAGRSMLTLRSVSGTFQSSETLTGGTSGATSTSGTINTNNIAAITNASDSKYYQAGGEIHYHFRMDFQATASAEVKIKLPAVPADMYIDSGTGSVFTIQATIDGGGGALGSGPVVFADKASRVNSTSNPFGYGVGYLRVLELSGDAWDLAAANNKVYVNVTYKVTGL